MDTLLHLADYFFLLFHAALTLFNVFGWIWHKTRRLNLITLLLTGGSWFILGLFYGIGYCPLTDWHWQVLRALGTTNLPNNYLAYLFERLTGILLDPGFVNGMTATFYFLALALSVALNIRDIRRKQR